MKKTLRLLLRQLPLILFVLALLFSFSVAYYFAYHYNDSDFASELLLGNFLAEQNKLISSDWFYGSELRVVSTNLVYMPLFKLFDDWRTVYFVGAWIIQLLLVGSYYYLSRQIGLKRNAFFLSAALMLLPVCILYGRFTLYQTYYAPCTILGFLIAGFYLSVIRHRGRQTFIAQGLRLFALFALAFAGSLNGARQIPGTILPLAAAAVAVSILSQPKHTLFIDILRRQWFQLTLAAAVCIFAGLGFWFQNAVLLTRYSIYISPIDSAVALPSADNFVNILTGYLSMFGYQENRLLFSAEGILALAGAFAAIVFLVFGMRNLLSRKAERTPEATFAAVMYPVAMILITCIFLATPKYQNYVTYFLPAFVWIFPFIGLFLQENPAVIRKLTVSHALVYLSCLILLGSGLYNALYFLDPQDKQVEYDFLSQETTETLHSFNGVVDFIEENGYEVGYATHWQANIITAATNGEIPMIRIIRVYPDFRYSYDDCLTYKQTRELSFVEDKEMFLLLTRDEADIFSGSDLAAFAILIYEDDNYKIFTFDFTTEVWEYLLEQAEYLNQATVLAQLQGEQK